MANESQILFLKVSCHRKPNKIKETLNNYAKSIGKVSQIGIINVKTVHEGNWLKSFIFIITFWRNFHDAIWSFLYIKVLSISSGTIFWYDILMFQIHDYRGWPKEGCNWRHGLSVVIKLITPEPKFLQSGFKLTCSW